MIPSRRDDKGIITARVSSPDEYATRAQDFFSKEGFFENSVANRIEEWDHIAHVWSTYESRHAKGEKPFARGINSFQLFNDGSRWWILTVYWEGEDPTHPQVFEVAGGYFFPTTNSVNVPGFMVRRGRSPSFAGGAISISAATR